MSKYLLLTGATGLVGQYLLRDLLLEGMPVAVLIRSKGTRAAHARLDHIMSHWEAELGKNLPRPVCLEGDIAEPGLGLNQSTRRWVARRVGPILHNAASLSFTGQDRDNEPWLSNLTGTANLLDFCEDLQLRQFFYMSTAYVCGRRQDLVYESDLDCGQEFRNDYEASKLEAEKLVRAAKFLDPVTVFRPAIIVGDSRTGYTTTYHAFYSYVFFLWQHCKHNPRDASGRIFAPVRLNVTGDEQRNLVPVDWVSAAASNLVMHPEFHGQTYHLTPARPITARELEAMFADFFQYYGPRFVGCQDLGRLSDLEYYFYRFVDQYQPYWAQEPHFDCTNTERALPHLPCPDLDPQTLSRMIDFAIKNNWGKKRKKSTEKTAVRVAEKV